ncbi:MAG: glycosyltransferase [Chloroflexi bacterium]|nr:glycosyltransferase [Chloroflexota bacterium]
MPITDRPLRVCYFGAYRANYSRNQIMIAGLRAAGVEVIECHVPLWTGIEDREQVAGGGWASLSFFKRLLSTYTQLLVKYAALDKNYDVMVVGYPGQLDVFLARPLSWLHGKPLVLDLFMSVYLVAMERGLGAKSAFSMKLLRWLEWLTSRLPDLLIGETTVYVTWHHQTHGLRAEKFRLVPLGANDYQIKPSLAKKSDNGNFQILYYGTYIPNHGVETIIEAAHRLRAQPDIQFELIGEGPTKIKAKTLANHYALENVIFIDWLDKEALLEKIAEADLILGIFGVTPQSFMTVQNKIYESLAMAKALITGDSPTVREVLTHRTSAYLIERANPQALAEGIKVLQADEDLRKTLSTQGYALYQRYFTIEQIGFLFKQHLIELVGPK